MDKQSKEGNITIGVTASGFPFSLFKEWEKDCKSRFNNLRWAKIWSDHIEAKNNHVLIEKIADLEVRLNRLEGSDQEEVEERITLGDDESE